MKKIVITLVLVMVLPAWGIEFYQATTYEINEVIHDDIYVREFAKLNILPYAEIWTHVFAYETAEVNLLGVNPYPLSRPILSLYLV